LENSRLAAEDVHLEFVVLMLSAAHFDFTLRFILKSGTFMKVITKENKTKLAQFLRCPL